MSEKTQRRLAAIVSGDVAGYSRLMGRDEAGTLQRLNAHRSELIDDLIEKHGGRIVKTTGDGLLLEFPSVVAAVECCVLIQMGMAARNADAGDDAIRFRIGVHLGDVIVQGDDIFGDGVNIAARLQEIAETDGVTISHTAQENVAGRIAAEFTDAGEQNLKNITNPVRVWRWAMDSNAGQNSMAGGAVAASLPNRPSLAVLPFTNISSDPEQEYFADGLTEDLITDLSKLTNLTVIARNSSFTFKGRQVDVREAARTLGVRNILEGSIRKMGARVRINAQLIDGVSGDHIWAERYDGDLADIFDLQDEILDKIVAALEVNLTPQDSDRTKHRATVNIEAYDLFLKGRTKFYTFGASAIQEARDLFQQAIEIDENFAEPYVFLSFIDFSTWLFLLPELPDNLATALSYAEQAVAIDELSGRARANLGWIQLWLGEHDKAIANMQRGVDLDPTNAESYAYFAETLNYAGEPERAAEMTRKALENDPMLPPNCLFHLGHSYYLLGRFEEAAETISNAMKITPEFHPGHLVLAAVYSELGQMDAAAAEVRILREAVPGYSVKEIDRLYPHRPPAVKQRFLDALAKAGMRPG